jgi:hypothetical protein
LIDRRAEAALSLGPFTFLYSPKCVEGVFSEVHIQNPA